MDRVVGRLIVGIHHNARFAVSAITPVTVQFHVDLLIAVLSVGGPIIGTTRVAGASTVARIPVRSRAWMKKVVSSADFVAKMRIATGHLLATKRIIAGAWARGVGRRRIDASNFSKYWKKFRG